ncbi:hypothetical protein [Amycolatopsis lexingtonensis]|uniref:hypothetical protein n=1 Tax=Amycolatopsis lexingtonensis TaxID=218822 RepID=UPI003F70215A
MPEWAAAGLWGLLGGAALVLGAAVAWWVRVPRRVVAGVLISALAFDLVDEAQRSGGLGPTAGRHRRRQRSPRGRSWR